jgi:hypothetical protein
VSVITPGMVRSSIFDDAPISSGENATWAERHRVSMRNSMVTHGMDSEPASRFIFEQLAAKTFWVSTQPEMTESFAAMRVEHLRARARPQLSAMAKQALGID